jgi:hypothetical protein
MAWNFQKRKKILPGVTLRVGKGGVGVRVGGKNAGVSVGSRGVAASASVPGSGLSVRKQLTGGRGRSTTEADAIDAGPARGLEGSRGRTFLGSVGRFLLFAVLIAGGALFALMAIGGFFSSQS